LGGEKTPRLGLMTKQGKHSCSRGQAKPKNIGCALRVEDGQGGGQRRRSKWKEEKRNGKKKSLKGSEGRETTTCHKVLKKGLEKKNVSKMGGDESVGWLNGGGTTLREKMLGGKSL